MNKMTKNLEKEKGLERGSRIQRAEAKKQAECNRATPVHLALL